MSSANVPVALFKADIYDGGALMEWPLDAVTIGLGIPADESASPRLLIGSIDEVLPRLHLALTPAVAAALQAALDGAGTARSCRRSTNREANP